MLMSVSVELTPVMAAGVTLKQMSDKHSQQRAKLSATDIMQESLKRHELYPYVYEEQTLVMVDDQQRHDVRRLYRYSRIEPDGAFKAMIKFVYPELIAGSALIFIRHPDGKRTSQLYLPSLGIEPIDYVGGVEDGQLLGSEFSVEDLMPEDMREFVYHREKDIVDADVVYFVLQAFPADGSHIRRTYESRKLLIRQDNFFVAQIDYRDKQNHLIKRQTRHDIHQVSGQMWRADMVIVENYLNHYRSILKIDRRVYSSDYVPESMFDVAQFGVVKRQVSEPQDISQPESASAMHEGETP
ncbi:MAG: outer membrane lipoprotein-sorting protein [Mariprofundus sp.]|nr:outer membrane lipoprotein-sorting protein [Mariprofundus sp.]